MDGSSGAAEHRPVLADAVVRYLGVRRGGTYVDGTAGEGGHALRILEAAGGKCRLVAVDADPEALAAAGRRLASHRDRCRLVHASYADLASIVGSPSGVDGILLDLGFSSFQMNHPARGFGFGPDRLDMRYDPNLPESAEDILRRMPEEGLAKLFWELGEEPESRAVARAVARERREAGGDWTGARLAAVVARAKRRRRKHIHPATLVFQALRIQVNRELENLDRILAEAPGLLRRGGRIVIISYHSLEDRRVKTAFREGAERGVWNVLTRKVVMATEEETRDNHRARSAKLRAAERV
ncbi:MAG: 16S rRNA (cytosine(1402)-N(4))-methyltransferase RsmH [Planctomycetota bacterium]